jgi:hypothetical protein
VASPTTTAAASVTTATTAATATALGERHICATKRNPERANTG